MPDTQTVVDEVRDPSAIEVELPEGLSLEDLQGTPESEPALTPHPEPVPPVAETPEPEPTPPPEPQVPVKRGDPRAALKRERDKTKALRRQLLDGVKQDYERIRHGAGGPMQPAVDQVVLGIPQPNWDEIRKVGEESPSMGALAEQLTRRFHTMANQGFELVSRRLAETRARDQAYLTQVAQEAAMRAAHDDYDETLTKAGIFDAVKPDGRGQPVDPVMFRAIYGTANPSWTAYQLAKAKLEEAEPVEEPDPVAEEPAPRGRTPRPSAPAAVATPAPKAAEAEAERRGAQKVVEQIASNAGRPRTIRAVPSAGQPTGSGRISFEALDRLADTHPEKFAELMEKNPDLYRRYLGGV